MKVQTHRDQYGYIPTVSVSVDVDGDIVDVIVWQSEIMYPARSAAQEAGLDVVVDKFQTESVGKLTVNEALALISIPENATLLGSMIRNFGRTTAPEDNDDYISRFYGSRFYGDAEREMDYDDFYDGYDPTDEEAPAEDPAELVEPTNEPEALSDKTSETTSTV